MAAVRNALWNLEMICSQMLVFGGAHVRGVQRFELTVQYLMASTPLRTAR